MYENYFPNIDNSIRGMMVVSNMEHALVFAAYPDQGFGREVKADTRVGYLTGRWVKQDNITYVQVYFETPLPDEEGNKFQYGCVNAAQYRTVAPNTIQGSKSLIEGLIANNKTILENNLLCAGMIAYIEAKGTTVPVEYKKSLYALQTRLQARNEKLLNSPFLDSKKTSSPVGFSKYESQLQEYMTDPGISIAPVVIYIVVSVVITLLTTAVLYMIFSKSYNESKSDIIYSKDLTATLLKKLTPEEYQLLLSENAENAKKIADMASGNSLIKTVKYFAAGFIGFKLITNLIDKEKTK